MPDTVITAEFIEKLTGKYISDVIELNLSGRKLKRIDASVFQQMAPHLSVLDLSDNELRSVPASIQLPSLRRLDLSENCIASLEFVESMPSLKELNVEGNGLQLADRLIAVLLCPTLEKIDGKPTDRLKSAVLNCRDKFLPVIEETWMESFAADHGGGVAECDQDAVMQDLVKKVRLRKMCAPGVPASFREFMVDKLATDLVMRAASGHYSPLSKKRRTSSSPSTPQRNVESMETEEEDDVDANENKVPATPSSKFENCPPVSDYDPHRFLRCHFCDRNALRKGHTDDDPTDETTNVWCCVMEPDPNDAAKMTGVVATCGGDSVCLIDYSTGQVMKRFKQRGEEFFCAAWTTLTLENDGTKSRTNILAVGGLNGHLRLLHPAQLICYAEHGSGRPNRTVANYYYNCLAFHPQQPTWIFCGSSDTTIDLFDIGVPQGSEYTNEIRHLAILGARASILNLFVSVQTSHIVAGTESGLFAWDVSCKQFAGGSSRTVKRRDPSMELGLPVAGKAFVDGLVPVDKDYVACKCADDGYIYIINVTSALQQQNAGRVYGLEWVKTDAKYIGLGATNGLLACGDHKGSIWLYNIKSVLSSRKNNVSKFLSPSRVIEWPNCFLDDTSEESQKMVDVLEKPEPLTINNVSISVGGEFIVAVTDCNLVCIWKRTKKDGISCR